MPALKGRNILVRSTGTFTLPLASKTTAGVYLPDGETLVRTLWSDVYYEAGNHVIKWEGNNDFGQEVDPGNYIIKIQYGDVTTYWDGVIGNTSAERTGDTVHGSLYAFMVGMTIDPISGKAFYCQGYSEGRPSIAAFSLSDVQRRISVEYFRITTANIDHIDTDGNYVYCSAYDPYQHGYFDSFVYAFNVDDYSKVTFANGTNHTQLHSIPYNAINIDTTGQSKITGLAVQKSGDYLFVSRAAKNTLTSINKMSGSVEQVLTNQGVTKLTVDPVTDKLWLVKTVEISTGFTKLTGTPLGDLDINDNDSKASAFDGDKNSYFYSKFSNNYIGLDFGSAKKIGTVLLFPLPGQEGKLTGCLIQGSNDGSTWTTLYTTSNIQYNQFSEFQVDSPVNYQYFQLTNPNNYLVVAEIEVYEEVFAEQHFKRVERFTVNTDGTITSDGIMIDDIVNPQALSVSPDGSILLIADASLDQQVVKAYNASTGAYLWTLGVPGGYMNDATVNDNKFYFNNNRYELGNNFDCFITFESDGSFWVNDPGNYRVQKYNSDREFVTRMMSLNTTYTVWVDMKNPTRVGTEFVEFEIDYDQPFTNSWTLTKNWGANLEYLIDTFSKFSFVTTLNSNDNEEKTFLFVRRLTGNNWQLVELTAENTVRFTKFISYNSLPFLDHDGLIFGTAKYAFTGEWDIDGDPVFSSTAEYLIGSLPDSHSNPPENYRGPFRTSDGLVIYWNYNAAEGSEYIPQVYRLSAIKTGEDDFLWRTEVTTHRYYEGLYPEIGFFDIGNTVAYAGGGCSVVGNFILTSYHGEFWKASQTNKFNLYKSNGLGIKQFGTTFPEHYNEPSPAEAAGNTIKPLLTPGRNSDELYVWAGDEGGGHSGYHRWHITGLDSVQEINVPITYPSPALVKTTNYINLMEGLQFLQNPFITETGRWSRNPTTDIPRNEDGTGHMLVYTNALTYKVNDPYDIWMTAGLTSQEVSVSCDLGSNLDLSSWKIAGEISRQNTEITSNSKTYIEVLDKDDKVIFRMYDQLTVIDGVNDNIKFYVNGQLFIDQIYQGTAGSQVQSVTPIEISAINGVIIVRWGIYTGVATVLQDSAADWESPTTLRGLITEGTFRPGGNLGFLNMKFYDSNTGDDVQVPIIDVQPESAIYAEGDSIVLSVTAHSEVTGHTLLYQWYKVNTPLTDGGRIGGAASNTLTISDAELFDTQFYKCKITDSVSSLYIYSETVAVKVPQLVTLSGTGVVESPAGTWTSITENIFYSANVSILPHRHIIVRFTRNGNDSDYIGVEFIHNGSGNSIGFYTDGDFFVTLENNSIVAFPDTHGVLSASNAFALELNNGQVNALASMDNGATWSSFALANIFGDVENTITLTTYWRSGSSGNKLIDPLIEVIL